MLPLKILKNHYAEYASRSDELIKDRERAKQSIVKHVINETGFKANKNQVKVAILGASDKRYIAVHKKIFTKLLGKPIKMTTLDVDTEHLGGESDTIITHDATKPFPNIPYDIVFSHELMKFLSPDEQLIVIKNSYQALEKDGIAMHILHEPSIKGTSQLREWQYRINPDKLIRQLDSEGISTNKLIFNSDTDIEWAKKTTIILTNKI